jgi:hypothetical protein
MPKEPPATRRIGKRSIIRVAAEEMAIVATVRGKICRGIKGLRQIDLDEVPTRSKGAGRAVGDEEQPVGR